MRKKLCLIFAAAVIFLSFQRGNAQTPDWLHIHGLVGQGMMKSTDNNYFMNTKDGSVAFNEAAVNFTAELSPKLRGGLQLFSRDFGPNGNNDIFLDWGFLDYRWKDYLGFRAGKIKRPSGFYNTIRDIDALRTSILLPQGVYDESMREFTMSAQGGSLYGIVPLKFAGDLEYELYYGISNIDPEMSFTQDIFHSIAKKVGVAIAGQLGAAGAVPPGAVIIPRVSNPKNEMKHSEGASLIWNTPLSGLRLGATRMLGKTIQSATLDYYVQMQSRVLTQLTIPFESTLKFKAMDTYSAEYIWNNLTLAAEYYYWERDIDTGEQNVLNMKTESYYGQAAYRFNSWLEAGTYYSVQYPNADDKKGELYSEVNQPDYLAWQKDLCLTLRFDLNPSWLIKLETHFMDGAAQLSQSLNPDGVEQNWQLYTVKTSIIF